MKILALTVRAVFKSEGLFPGPSVDDVDDLGLAPRTEDLLAQTALVARRARGTMSEVVEFRLRKPERNEIDALYVVMSDPGIASMLGGFSIGSSTTDLETVDLEGWGELNCAAKDEALARSAARSSSRGVRERHSIRGWAGDRWRKREAGPSVRRRPRVPSYSS